MQGQEIREKWSKMMSKLPYFWTLAFHSSVDTVSMGHVLVIFEVLRPRRFRRPHRQHDQCMMGSVLAPPGVSQRGRAVVGCEAGDAIFGCARLWPAACLLSAMTCCALPCHGCH